MRRVILTTLGLAVACSAQAFDRIPKKDGFSGYVYLGASTNRMESNTVATLGGTDVSDSHIDSLNSSPDSKSFSKILPAFGLSYKLQGSRTEFFGGTELEDFLTQDGTLALGVRQGIGQMGNLSASFLASTPVEVWEDPYLVNGKRKETDRTSSGARVAWEHIFQSDFDVTLTHRKIDIDDENSGEALGLTPAQRDLLDREGDENKVDVRYVWGIGTDHIVIPTLSYINRDLDGDAMAMDGYQLELNYAYTGFDRWELVTNLTAGHLESDDDNPIYDKKTDLDRMGISLAATYKEPFGLKNWRARVVANYGEEDSNVDFYDTSIKSLSLGMLYNF
ncbi:DUF2860 family protein [Pseudomonas sp. NPDC078700]|uniref:DUF2860 family protein n=1 Tax=Pseudomonas sp. NPDC078700 TaxID=3364424 RepID=UPI0037C8CAD2